VGGGVSAGMIGGPKRRFWRAAAAAPLEASWTVLLDGRPVRTPAGAPFAAPRRVVAEAAAAEWDAQGETVDPTAMPVTRAVNTAIDRIAPQIDGVRREIAGYGGTDLLCYRAPHPQALAERQAAAWDPWLGWARDRLGAPLICGAGVMHVAQPPESLARLADAVAARDALALAALHDLTALSGSLILALAVSDGALGWEAAWETSRVDETWQIEQWGEDAEAAETAARKQTDFAAAARLSALLRTAESGEDETGAGR
jgi:chaperone required for assembly of F1-ATPase